MGTNFYIHEPEAFGLVEELGENNYGGTRTHIGKRSAAGLYCWDCMTTLRIGGKALVHTGSHRDTASQWYDACPQCGKHFEREPLDTSSVGLELGVAPARTQETRRTGIATCSSFTWAMKPGKVLELCAQLHDQQFITDEYGRLMTGDEFMQMLKNNCPIVFTDSIGHDFS